MTLMAEIEEGMAVAVRDVMPKGSAAYTPRDPYREAAAYTVLVSYISSEYSGYGCTRQRQMKFAVEFRGRNSVDNVMESVRPTLEMPLTVASHGQPLEPLIIADQIDRQDDGLLIGQQVYQIDING